MDLPPVESELEKQQPKSSETLPVRFTYASGSRPLDGYQIKRGVGRGGFGEVYFAVSDAGKEVALKLIRRNLDVEVRGVTQCLNLKHQNLVALYDIRNDEHDDRWVVMEYVSGESLDDAVARHPEGMPIELAMSWFSGIAAGVAYLHDHGIVHRDLKPANIFLDEGIVKIGDYGLSKFISCSRRSGQTESVGTVHYMAPEIANGRYGKEIDTYALGIILYEMLTGHVPFEGESIGEVLMKHLTAEPDLSVLEEPYREIVRGAMTKDPDTRIQNVAEMLGRLPSVAGVPRYATAAVDSTAAVADSQPANNRAEQREGVASASVNLASEEPIQAWVQAGWDNFQHNFHNSTLHPLVKVVLSIVVIACLIFSSELWVPMSLFLAFAYIVYRGIRAVVIGPTQLFSQGGTTSQAVAPTPTSTAPTSQQAPPRVPTPQEVVSPPVRQTKRQYARRRRQNWQQQVNQFVTAKPMRVRMTELLGSMIVAAAIASLLSILGCAVVGGDNPATVEFYVWMSIVATVGSWLVMVPAKLAEGRLEDQSPLRFGLLVAGAVVGLVACGTASAMMLKVPVSQDLCIGPWDTLAGEILQDRVHSTLSQAFRNGAVPLSLPTTIAYFAFLFVILRWWRQAEYARPERVSLWSIASCMAAAYLMTFIWWFPQPLGTVMAGIIAVATQLSSPWMPPSKRRELAEQGA